MKKQIKNLILILILVFSMNASFCYTLTSGELKEDILSKIKPEIKAQLNSYSSDYKINILGIPTNSIQTNEQIKPKIEVISQNNNFSSNQYRRILVKNSNGTIIKAFPITIQTQVFADVLTASKAISYNEEINLNNSKIQRKEISKYLGKTYSNLNSNLIAKRNYQKDSVIIANYTKENSCVLKNSNIDIVFQSKNLNIKVRGKALKEGALGDKILVRSEKYNKTYTGTIESANEVVVRI